MSDRSKLYPVGQATRSIENLPRGNGETVLVVDDDPVQRRLADRTLKQLGYQVTVAASGEEAVALTEQKPFDVLLLDMVMDGIDGTETLRRIKTQYPQQKAILFSGFASDDRVRQAIALGAREFLSKPVRVDVMAHAMNRALHPEESQASVK